MSETKIQNKRFLIIAIIGGIIILSSVLVIRFSDDIFYTSPYPGVGKLGSDHQHARFQVIIDEYRWSSSPVLYDKYKNANEYILIEPDDGNTIHRFATGATLDIFFNSLGMQFTKDCFIVPEKTFSVHKKELGPAEYCNQGEKTLKFYINNELNDEYEQYVIQERDRVLIIYGNQTEAVTNERLQDLFTPRGPGVIFIP